MFFVAYLFIRFVCGMVVLAVVVTFRILVWTIAGLIIVGVALGLLAQRGWARLRDNEEKAPAIPE